MSQTMTQDKFGEQEFWDKVAGRRVYAAFDIHEYEEIIDRSFGKDLTGLRIIDVGSASGVSASLYAARGAEVVAIDISPELIRRAKDLWKDYRERIDFQVGDAENLNFAPESFDACFFGGVLHHFPDCSRVYAETLRVLKPGGKLIAIEPNLLDIYERIEWLVAGLRGKLSPNEDPIDPLKMRRELEDFGFRDVEFWNTRHDVPALAQIWGVGSLFRRGRGYWLKTPLLRIADAFRPPECQGTFFVMTATKP